MTRVIQTSPHALGSNSTRQIMIQVLLATLPGLAAQTFFFGWGSLINILWASAIALTCEALVLTLRRRPVAFYLKDGSALVSAWLLALALPPLAPWWLTLIGTAFALVIGKQLYGGLGQNPFNPAMLGYVLLLISFPLEMTRWLPPLGLDGSLAALPQGAGLLSAFSAIFSLNLDSAVDAISMATPLDVIRENTTLTMVSLWAQKPVLSGPGGLGWVWVNLGYLVGGLFLLYRRVFTWHAPVAMLVTLTLMATLFWGGSGPQSHGAPLFHLLSGATMLGAFFIVTDPVTSATSNRGRLIFGAGVGLLVYIIRAWGGYPDGVAFAILLMNMAAPAIDYVTQPRTYGHRAANRGLPEKD